MLVIKILAKSNQKTLVRTGAFPPHGTCRSASFSDSGEALMVLLRCIISACNGCTLIGPQANALPQRLASSHDHDSL